MIEISDKAAKQIAHIRQEEEQVESFLRVSVIKGGCSGMSYQLDFDTSQKEGDHIFEKNGQKVVVDKDSYLYLIGMTLNFSGGLSGQGFVFENPNAKKSCGCGSSFGV